VDLCEGFLSMTKHPPKRSVESMIIQSLSEYQAAIFHVNNFYFVLCKTKYPVLL